MKDVIDFETGVLSRVEGLRLIDIWDNGYYNETPINLGPNKSDGDRLVLQNFFNPVISYLYKKYPIDDPWIKSRFVNISELDKVLLEQTLRRVKKHFEEIKNGTKKSDIEILDECEVNED